MKRLVMALVLILCLTSGLPRLFQAEELRGFVPIRDKSGQQVGLYRNSYALVIGVSEYTNGWPKLPGVKKDIESVKKILETHGFQVTLIENPATRDELDKTFHKFINQYGQNPDDRLLFYFAGHGHTVKLSYEGEMGYIVPANAPDPNKDPNGFLAEALDMEMVEVYAKRIQSKHALFLFDSCFSGKIFAITRAAPEDITYKTSKPVRQFITSGSADEQVSDKSIFCSQFVAALKGEADTYKDGYVTGTELGEFLETTVINYSKGRQHPQYGKLQDPLLDKGDFVLPLNINGASKIDEMRKAFNQLKSSEKKDASFEERLAVWDQFLETFKEDDPHSQEDDDIRQGAGLQIDIIVAEASEELLKKENTPISPPANSSSTPAKGTVIKGTADKPSKEITGKDGAPMVLIPAGEFSMGDVFNEGDSNEQPVHTVYLNAFYIDKYEVTNALYKKFIDATGHEAPGNSLLKYTSYAPNQPVIGTNWYDAVAYGKWAGKRLPTEAEWEKAARGGLVGKRYPWDDNISHSYANYAEGGNKDTGGKDEWQGLAPVGSYAPNGYGLYDMAGNIREWCADWYDNSFYANSPKQNPEGPFSGKYRVIRGGSFICFGIGFSSNRLRVADRDKYIPARRDDYFPARYDGDMRDVGFRCVQDIAP